MGGYFHNGVHKTIDGWIQRGANMSGIKTKKSTLGGESNKERRIRAQLDIFSSHTLAIFFVYRCHLICYFCYWMLCYFVSLFIELFFDEWHEFYDLIGVSYVILEPCILGGKKLSFYTPEGKKWYFCT